MILKIYFLILLLTSCAEDFSGGTRTFPPPQEEQQFAPAPDDFRTRLSNTLLIEGIKCRGNETTEPAAHGVLCDAGQYLIFIDDVNTCDSAGICTDYLITPIIGELLNINAKIEGFSIFDIIPKSILTLEQANILKGVSVSTDVNGNGTAFYKYGPIANTSKPIQLRIFSVPDLNE